MGKIGLAVWVAGLKDVNTYYVGNMGCVWWQVWAVRGSRSRLYGVAGLGCVG